MNKIIPVISVSLITMFLFFSCRKEHSCESCNPVNGGNSNKAPIARAGNDQVINLPVDTALLDGSLSSDPDGTIIQWAWRKTSGPVSSTIVNTSAASTPVKNLIPGIYQFELKVYDDKGLNGLDTVQVIVNDPLQPNRPPIASAGNDQTIVWPSNSISVDGSGSTDPDNNITGYIWTQIFGPGSANIVSPLSVQTQITMLTSGVYFFELRVTDLYGLFSKDTMELKVNNGAPPPGNCDTIFRPIIPAQIADVGTLSHARFGMTTVTAGTKIFFAGASLSAAGPPYFNEYGSSRVDIFDWSTQTWSTAELSEKRSNIASVALGNKVFFAGGRLGDGAFDQLFSTVDIYDISTNTWTVAHLSQPRAYIAAAAVGNKVMFAGGEKDWDYQTSDVVDIYDISTNNWSSTRLGTPRAFISAVTLNNKVYFAGGSTENRWYANPSARIDIYDNATDSWSSSSLSQPMLSPTGIATSEKILWSESCRVDILNVSSGNISPASLFSPASWLEVDGYKAVKKNNKIIYLRSTSGNRFDIYDIPTNTWSVGELSQPFYGGSVIVANNTIYVAGGAYGNNNFSDKVRRIDF